MEEKEILNENIKEIKKEKVEILKKAIIERKRGPWQEPLMAYLIMSIDDLKESTEKSSRIANKLAKSLVSLTVILAFGAIVGAVATAWMAFKIRSIIAVIIMGIFLLAGIIILFRRHK